MAAVYLALVVAGSNGVIVEVSEFIFVLDISLVLGMELVLDMELALCMELVLAAVAFSDQ